MFYTNINFSGTQFLYNEGSLYSTYTTESYINGIQISILGLIFIIGSLFDFKFNNVTPSNYVDQREDITVEYFQSNGKESNFNNSYKFESIENLENQFCPCCGYNTINDLKLDSKVICPICYWKNDPIQLTNPNISGANNISLNKAKLNFEEFGASEYNMIQNVRKVNDFDIRNINHNLK